MKEEFDLFLIISHLFCCSLILLKSSGSPLARSLYLLLASRFLRRRRSSGSTSDAWYRFGLDAVGKQDGVELGTRMGGRWQGGGETAS